MLHKIKVKGRIEILEEGKVIYCKDNLVVNDGLGFIGDRLMSNSVNFLDYIAVGTDDTTVLATDVTLGSELERNQMTVKSATSNQITMETLFTTSEAIGSWKEAGCFNAVSSGVMFNRVNIDYTKGATNTTVRFTITFTNT